MEYGKRLNPEQSLRTPKGIKGTQQKVIVTHNPSEIDQAQELLVRFPNLGSDDVIIPGTANLSSLNPEHLVVLLAGPISHTSTQYIDFVDFLHFNGSVYQLFCPF